MSTDVSDEVLTRLRAAVASGDAERLGVDFWDRGGPPGQGYESDVLIVRPEVEVLMRTRFDKAFAPPFRVEEHKAPPDDAARGELLALALQAFEKAFPEEQAVPMGGATKVSLKVYVSPPPDKPVTTPPPEITKTFFLKLPDELASLDKLARARIAALAALPANVLSTRAH